MPVPAPDNNLSTLDQIRIKVRRITRSPSINLLSDADLDNYINTFVLYDFPEQLRLFSLRSTFEFYTQPYVDIYENDEIDPTSIFYNFKNLYISFHEPLYIAGFQQFYTQSREQFFAIYPQTNSIQSIGPSGDGVTTTFSGTLAGKPIQRNNVLFSSVDSFNNDLALVDIPASTTFGNLVVPNNLTTPQTFLGTINYITGAYAFTFPFAPRQGQAINSQTIPYTPSVPSALLFYDNKFTLRPIPDQAYKISLEAYKRPAELLAGNAPELSQWWQYIAYGAAKKVFDDRMDLNSIKLIYPEFKFQENMVLRKTIVQQTNERASTIFTEQTQNGSTPGWGWGGPF